MAYRCIYFIILLLPIVSISKIFIGSDIFSLTFDLVFLVFCFIMLFTGKVKKCPSAIFWFFCLTAIFFFSSLIKNDIPSLYEKISAFRLSALFTYAFFIPFFFDDDEIDYAMPIFIKLIMFVGLVVSINGIRQWAFPLSAEIDFANAAGGAAKFYGDEFQGSQNSFRIFSSLITSVHLVVFLSFVFYVSLSRMLSKVGSNTFNAGVVVFTFICILLTYSRTGYLAFFCGLVFFFPLILKRGGFKSALTVMLAVIVLVVVGYLFYINNPLFQSRFSALNNVLEVSAFDTRLTIWSERWSDIMTHPLGFGVGSAGWNVQQSMQLGVDSNYLKPIVELGWVGGSLYLLFMAIIFFKSITQYFSGLASSSLSISPGRSIMSPVYPAFIFSCLIQMITNQILEAYPVNIIFWLVAGWTWVERMRLNHLVN